MVEAACSEHHTMVLASNGGLLAFGRNNKGQLGVGDVEEAQPRAKRCRFKGIEPTRFASVGNQALILQPCHSRAACHGTCDCCCHKSSIPCPFSSCFVHTHCSAHTLDPILCLIRQWHHWAGADLVVTLTVVQVACGADFTLGVTTQGQLFGWGSGHSGQLGCGDFLSPTSISRMMPTLMGTAVVQVVCGEQHAVLLTASGQVLTCGGNRSGQLGQGDTTARLRPTPLDPPLPRVVEICSGSHHTMALSIDGGIFAWGASGSGQLGIGHVQRNQLVPTKVLALEGTRGVHIAAGDRHSAAVVLTSGGRSEVYLWGAAACGQLGLGTTTAQHSPGLSNITASAMELVGPDVAANGGSLVYELQLAGQHSFVVVKRLAASESPLHHYVKAHWIPRISSMTAEGVCSLVGREEWSELQASITAVFSSTECLNVSFLPSLLEHIAGSDAAAFDPQALVEEYGYMHGLSHFLTHQLLPPYRLARKIFHLSRLSLFLTRLLFCISPLGSSLTHFHSRTSNASCSLKQSRTRSYTHCLYLSPSPQFAMLPLNRG